MNTQIVLYATQCQQGPAERSGQADWVSVGKGNVPCPVKVDEVSFGVISVHSL